MFSLSWLRNAASATIAAFALGFVGVIVSAGTNNLNASTVHAAITGGIIAGLAAAQSLLAAVAGGKSTDTAFVGRALVNRVGDLISNRPPAVDQQSELTEALIALKDLPAALTGLSERIDRLGPPDPPAAA